MSCRPTWGCAAEYSRTFETFDKPPPVQPAGACRIACPRWPLSISSTVMKPLKFPRITLVLMGVACWAACEDSAGPLGPGDAGLDVGVDVVEDAFVERCEGIVEATRLGDPCGGFDPCGEGAQCARLDSSVDEGVCRQLCVPGTCESVCGQSEVCVPLAEAPGTGVCADALTGPRSAYEECSASLGYCLAGLTCLVGSAGATAGVCLPSCDDGSDCATEDASGQCVIRVSSTTGTLSYCAPSCAGPEATSCPGAMRCLASGDGHVCAFSSE